MPRMTMIEAIRSAMDVCMGRDETVVVFGEDVGYFGGVFRCTQGLQQKYGVSRCFDAPISELGIVGVHAQQLVRAGEVGAHPQAQAVGDAEHLAVARQRREGHAVQVVEHHVAPRFGRVLPVAVDVQARGQDLAELVGRRAGPATGRVPELLDLRRERAAAGPPVHRQ